MVTITNSETPQSPVRTLNEELRDLMIREARYLAMRVRKCQDSLGPGPHSAVSPSLNRADALLRAFELITEARYVVTIGTEVPLVAEDEVSQ